MISKAAWEAAPARTQMADANMIMPAGQAHTYTQQGQTEGADTGVSTQVCWTYSNKSSKTCRRYHGMHTAAPQVTHEALVTHVLPGIRVKCQQQDSGSRTAAALLTKGYDHPEGQHSTLPEVGHDLCLRGWHCQVSWVQHLALQHEPHKGDAGHPGRQGGCQSSTVHVEVEAWGTAGQGRRTGAWG